MMLKVLIMTEKKKHERPSVLVSLQIIFTDVEEATRPVAFFTSFRLPML